MISNAGRFGYYVRRDFVAVGFEDFDDVFADFFNQVGAYAEVDIGFGVDPKAGHFELSVSWVSGDGELGFCTGFAFFSEKNEVVEVEVAL